MLAAQSPNYTVVAAADPNPIRVQQIKDLSGNPAFRSFSNDRELFKAGKLADVCIIGTQDSYHVEPALQAMELGYDILLEKPIASDPARILELLDASERLGRKVMVCHVLRYAPFYVKIREIIESGLLGDIMAVDAHEGVGPWHQAHSFVRGHWAVSGKATPMLVAKSCHDLDIISWMVGRPCSRVGSFGSLGHFRSENKPPGAPARCTDGCPVGDTCFYNATLYATRHSGWLEWVMDRSHGATRADIINWIAKSPWGRCVYDCDNDVVDHQVVMMDFEGGAVGTFTMTAFDHGRDILVCGTRGRLRGGDNIKKLSGHDMVVTLNGGEVSRHNVVVNTGGYEGHGGGDYGIVQALKGEMALPPRRMRSGLFASLESHFIGFGAEQSRLTGSLVDLKQYRAGLQVPR